MSMLNFLSGTLSAVDKIFFSSPVVLTYHSISDGRTPLSLRVDVFRQQMAFLKSIGIQVLTLGEFLNVVSGKSGLKEKSVLITFDDAFRDIYLNALSILREFRFPAAVFINSDTVGKRATFATRAEDREREICGLSDLYELERHGIAIANHGHSHRQLSELPEREVFSEYEKARTFIADHFKGSGYPDVFVFPKGAKNEKVKVFLKNRGAQILEDRIDIYSDTSMFKFALKISNTYLWLRRKIFRLK